MEKLNELVYRAEGYLLTKAESQPEQINVSCKTILAIAEAFRELEQEVQKNLDGALAWQQRAEAAEAALERESDIHIDTAESMREWRLRAEAAEAKLAELEKQEPVAYVHPAYLQAGALGFDASVGRLAPAQIPLFTRPAPAADLVPIGRVDRGEVSDNNEYPNALVVCLHDQADWENFPDGTELFLRPDPAVGMDKPEPYAWLVHAPQGDYVERNPEVVAHLEGTGLTKCKPLYLDL